jgi:hypothetical protein
MMIGRTGRAGLPLLCEAEERVGERRRVTKNCDRHTSHPSLRLSPRSFLVGRECQVEPLHELGVPQASVHILPIIRPNWYKSNCVAVVESSRILRFVASVPP